MSIRINGDRLSFEDARKEIYLRRMDCFKVRDCDYHDAVSYYRWLHRQQDLENADPSKVPSWLKEIRSLEVKE